MDFEVSYSDEFIELYSDCDIPKFYRLIPSETVFVENNEYANQDMNDFMLSQKSYLIISEDVKNFLEKMNVADNADYTELKRM